MISLALVILAAIFKAVADTLQHHFDSSVFKNKNQKWWNPLKSWAYVGYLPFTKYRPDAWHLSNSLMIVCFVAAIVFHLAYFSWWVEIIIGGVAFNVSFNVFYNKILR